MFCKKCGLEINSDTQFCPRCGTKSDATDAELSNGFSNNLPQQAYHKSRIATAVIAFFLGGLGIHRFYLGGAGNVILGIFYILFCWTGIPSLLAFIECIYFLVISDENFYTKY
jgi:TM2 domain-containing membrane protein YozV